MTLQLPWSTIGRLIAAVALIWLCTRLVWLFLLLITAIVISVGLLPVVTWLERRRWPRWVASTTVVGAIVAVIALFTVLTWTTVTMQAQTVAHQTVAFAQQFMAKVPAPLMDVLRQGNATPDLSGLTPYLTSFVRSVATAIGAFLLAWVLVLYLLIEREQTYRWVRGFVPLSLRPRFDATAGEACKVARGYVAGNLATSVCAAIYFFVWLTALGVPGALLLALLAFVVDFVPVLGFYLSCLPAMAMASTVSGTVALLLIPIYLAYHVIENYVIAPRVYSGRLPLSNVAILMAFAIGGTLAGVLGALLALPAAAIYPTIERLWLRRTLGDEVIAEHAAAGR